MPCVTHHLLLRWLQVLLLLSTGFSRAHPDLMAQAAVEVLGLCLVRAPYAAINHAAQAAAKLHALPEMFAGQQAAVLSLRPLTGLCKPFGIPNCEACLVQKGATACQCQPCCCCPSFQQKCSLTVHVEPLLPQKLQ